ncbi:hypothetical protein [Cronobacter dublinensis]|uniref:hypothetical protein n=1 Tax=Cronobacter dublinensis TaxID=413497 RepID=UPI000CFD9FE9|nr:hypothetical protein [Cronobacter dublinensis]
MKRIGFLGLNKLSESIVKAIYRTVPETQVFLYPSDCSNVQKLAKAYPCWTLNDCQSVSEESEIIIFSTPLCDLKAFSEKLKFCNVRTLVSLSPEVSIKQLRLLFPYSDCVRMAIISREENDSPIAVLTGNNPEVERFLCQIEFGYIIKDENDINFKN